MSGHRLTDAGYTLHHPPSGELMWTAHGVPWVSTGTELWRLGSDPVVWPIADVRRLFVQDDRVLVETPAGRSVLGGPSQAPLQRIGLDTAVRWTHAGWHCDALVLPRGARRSPDLQPLVSGIGVCWSSGGQAYEQGVDGIVATREADAGWLAAVEVTTEPVATAQAGHRLWGPGRRLWDLRAGTHTPLAGWADGPAAAHGKEAVVVDRDSGLGLWLTGSEVTSNLRVALRRDMPQRVVWDDEGVRCLTDLGRRHSLSRDSSERLPGRELPEPVLAVELPNLPVSVDASATVDGVYWAWRTDGLLVRSVGG